MKMTMSPVVGFFFLSFINLIGGVAHAADATIATPLVAQQLLKGTSDAFAGALNMQVLVDNQGRAKMIRTTGATGSSDHDLSLLPTGIVIYNSQGRDIVIVKSSDFNEAHGGTVELDYLVSGITNEYQSTMINIDYSAKKWEVLVDSDNRGNHVVTSVYFQANKFFGQTIGISSITFQ